MSFVTKAEETDRTIDSTIHQQRCDVQAKVDLGTVASDQGQEVVVFGGECA